MDQMGDLKKKFDQFKETKYALPAAVALTLLVTSLVLVFAYYFCFSYALIAVIAFGIPYYFGLKQIKKLAILGVFLFLVLGLVFGVSGYYEWQGWEGDPVGSPDGPLSNGTMTEFNTYVQYAVFMEGSNGSDEVTVALDSQWREEISLNLTMVPTEITSSGATYVNNTTLSEGVYLYTFHANTTEGWVNTGQGIGPINISDGDFISSMVFSRMLLVFLNIALLYYILLGMVWWSRSSRQRYERRKREQEEMELPDEEPKEEEKMVCSERGSEVPGDATECPPCGEPFEEETEQTEGTAEKFICSECGAEVEGDAESCWNCGKKFEN